MISLKLLKKIGKKNQNLVKISKSSKKLSTFKDILSRQKTEKIIENKKFPIKRKPTQNSEKICNFKNKIKRCKTFCKNNYNKIVNH